MMDNCQVIDVDSYKLQIDLTQGPEMIDLTQDDGTVSMSTPWPTYPPTRTQLMNNPYCHSPGFMDAGAKRKRARNVPIPTNQGCIPGHGNFTVGSNATNNYPAATSRWRPKHEAADAISIASDPSEDEVEDQLVRPATKKLRQEGYEGYDSDDDYDRFLVGMNDEAIWKPLPNRKAELNDEKPLDGGMPPVGSLALERSEKQVDNSRLAVTRQYPTRASGVQTTASNMYGAFNWTPRLFRTRHEQASLLPNMISLPHQRFTVPKGLDNIALSRTHSFKRSPGCVMRVIQKEGQVVVCSTCLGGGPDVQDETISPYNEEGSLIAWHDGNEVILDGHRCPLKEDKWKYYSVNDIKFHPTSTSFVSSGNDKKVRAWEKDPDSGEYFEARAFGQRYTYPPNEIAFKPGTKKLAVAEKKIHVYQDYEFSIAHDTLTVVPHSVEHTVGGMCWGTNATDGYLFASSEPIDDECFVGYHKAFNVESATSYELDSEEAGDSIALTPDGELLVHTSRGTGGKHPLRLYDVRRRNGRAIRAVDMDPFRPNMNGEVNSVSISPDGIYIAIARNDNRIHIYDNRILAKGKMYEYEHKGKDLTTPGAPSCGVVEVRWAATEFSRLTLVSGGADGCVRLWDPLEALSSPMNGIILGQVNSDIGHFALGDSASREQQLVVGDSSGEVTIFNTTKTYICPL